MLGFRAALFVPSQMSNQALYLQSVVSAGAVPDTVNLVTP